MIYVRQPKSDTIKGTQEKQQQQHVAAWQNVIAGWPPGAYSAFELQPNVHNKHVEMTKTTMALASLSQQQSNVAKVDN